MKRVSMGIVLIASLMVPYFVGRYHATHIGLYPFGSRYDPAWLILYGATFALSAFIFGIPTFVERPRQAILGSFLAAATPTAAASIFFVVYNPLIPRLVVVGSPTVLFAVYLVASLMHAIVRRFSLNSDRVIAVVGADDHAALEHDVSRSPERKFTLLRMAEPPEVDAAQSLVDMAISLDANLLVLSESAQASESIVAQAATLHEHGMRIRSLATFYDEWLGKFPVKELERSSLWFDIRDIHEAQYSRLKRVMDVTVACCVAPLLALAIPIVAIGNRIGNRGPIFFKQARVGQRDSQFTMWKFRSMSIDANVDGVGQWTASDDPRITAFGKILRKSHLDELPQIVNVLAGDLSIVGPRPEQPHYVQDLTEKIPFYRMRHAVKPGITGWAQVKYPYGASEEDALEKLQYELYYLKHQSPSLDMRICVRTLRSMFFGEGR